MTVERMPDFIEMFVEVFSGKFKGWLVRIENGVIHFGYADAERTMAGLCPSCCVYGQPGGVYNLIEFCKILKLMGINEVVFHSVPENKQPVKVIQDTQNRTVRKEETGEVFSGDDCGTVPIPVDLKVTWTKKPFKVVNTP